MPETYVAAAPYPWPYNGDLRPQNTVLIIIDMQTDFCGVGGYVDKMGYDLSLTRAPIEPIKRTLAAMRAAGFHIFHTREGHSHVVSNGNVIFTLIGFTGLYFVLGLLFLFLVGREIGHGPDEEAAARRKVVRAPDEDLAATQREEAVI